MSDQSAKSQRPLDWDREAAGGGWFGFFVEFLEQLADEVVESEERVAFQL
jgi:hypothetical protein